MYYININIKNGYIYMAYIHLEPFNDVDLKLQTFWWLVTENIPPQVHP